MNFNHLTTHHSAIFTHRYHDRYFPEHFYHDDRNDYEEDDEPERPAQVIRQQVSVGIKQN